MSTTPTIGRSRQRSRGGCERCRKRRQKCDQKQPACSRCHDAQTPCVYKLQLRWGGRDFSRSAFGTCGARKIEIEEGKFVYGGGSDGGGGRTVEDKGVGKKMGKVEEVETLEIDSRDAIEPVGTTEFIDLDSVDTNPINLDTVDFFDADTTPSDTTLEWSDTALVHQLSLIRQLPRQHPPLARLALPALPGVEPWVRAHLDYFVQRGSAAISLHRQMQEETCRALVPAAVGAPALLQAILAFSAAQQATYAADGPARRRLNLLELQARMRSIRILQEDMGQGVQGVQGVQGNQNGFTVATTRTSPAVVLGTSLMLCLCTLYGGNDDYGSWRVYLRGARAAFSAAHQADDPLTGYLRKRYNLLEVLAMLSTDSFEALEGGGGSSSSTAGPLSSEPAGVFDDHVACYTDLFNLLRVIGAVAWERRRRVASSASAHISPGSSGPPSGSLSPPSPTPPLSPADFDAEADNLETELRRMMARNARAPPVLRPAVRAALEPGMLADFALCNAVHEQYALLQIRAEIRGWPSTDPRVQAAVRAVIALAARMQLRPGLSPAQGLNTPLFGAGQHATTVADRAQVRDLLERLYAATHNRNLLRSVRRLEAEHWLPSDGTPRSKGPPNPDFITY